MYTNPLLLYPVTCTCAEGAQPLQPWQRPLLTQRRGLRRDAQSSRVNGGFVNGKPVRPGDASLELHLQSRNDRSAPSYDRWRRMQDPARRGDATESAWQWGTQRTFGGGGTVRVGPGWADDAPRFDAGEVELVINGERCFVVNGAWVTADGEPCCFTEEG